MELLFKDATGNVELKSLLGFLDLDLKFANIKAKIITATNDVINIVGQEMYDKAVVEYKKADDATDKNNDIIFNFQYPIAIQAYRKFAPHNDLSHTNKGRVNRIEDKEKTPFEWMIEKDNQALERSYYEALDDLIRYLEKNITAWKETDSFKKTHELFITTAAEFDDIFPIGNSRLLLLKLAPGLRKAEDEQIKSRIGTELFAALKADASSNITLVKKIKEGIVYQAMAWGLRRLNVQMFPEGVLQGFISDRMTMNARKAPEFNEAYTAAHFFEADAKQAFTDIESIITKLNQVPGDLIAPLTYQSSSDDKFLTT